MRRLLALLFCLCSLSGAALAAPIDDTLAKFASTKFDDIEAAITELAASGEPQAAAILQALTDGRLLIDPASKRAYVKDAADALTDAATGQAAPADLDAS